MHFHLFSCRFSDSTSAVYLLSYVDIMAVSNDGLAAPPLPCVDIIASHKCLCLQTGLRWMERCC